MNWLLKLLKIQDILRSPEDVEGIEDITPDEQTDDTDDVPEDKEKDDDSSDKDDDTDADGKEEDDKDEKDDEDKEDTEEDKEDEEDDKDRTTTYTDVKKEFPDVFKKFPDLKAALFRDEKYTEIFGSVKAAEQAASDAEALSRISHDLIEEGDPTKLLDVIKKNNEKSYEKVALTILPYLQKSNKDLYAEVAALPIKQLLRAAFSEGDAKSDKNLKNAALYIHKFFFNDTNLATKVKAEDGIGEKEKSKEQKEYEDKIKELNTREYNTFKGSIDNSYISKMEKEIRNGFEKDERITPFMANVLVEKILLEIREQLDGDTSYQGKLNSLWKQAASSKFSDDFKSRITNTALARAKSLIPEVRKRLVSEALSGKKKQKENDNKDNKNSRDKDTNNRGNRSNERNRNAPEKKLTDMDILRGRD